jgi:hypothetical protein
MMPGMAQRSHILIDWLLDAIFGRHVPAIQETTDH